MNPPTSLTPADIAQLRDQVSTLATQLNAATKELVLLREQLANLNKQHAATLNESRASRGVAV